ncbi:hypothetical protein OAR37_02225 [Flavobacteriaceae bacterium]|uniref:hypothetical protein n=1 Tax=Candidatus Arcticimaribacter forsetii TaxID=2820661 RepID=UPI002076D81B|nr:hypothetical protein [Candidatus Arcticimaribacter forsetii]MDB2329497.1 hypothetical protein [Flavobacteriaceae bacterium]MDB2345556.1 hypothetical protein [Flavobacteriaceae bacterium]MDB4620452.1 hypothetical protein [Flavobacteriaceae bacterium]MDB4674147.1 hypothetical protein [Flavobacteriaceae bacterium]MDB4738608.1 hypothetical protein [Flavobacteriaceae bacterium]
MNKKQINEFEALKIKVGRELKRLRIQSGYRSYEVFAWDNKISRIQYWKMEKGTNFTLKSLLLVLDIHNLKVDQFFNSLYEEDDK